MSLSLVVIDIARKQEPRTCRGDATPWRRPGNRTSGLRAASSRAVASARCAAAVPVLALGAALLGMPAVSQADVLISNIDQQRSGFSALSAIGTDYAQGFQAGGNMGDYTLESIEIGFFAHHVPPSREAANLVVTVSSAIPGRNRLDTLLATLINPSDLSVSSGANVKRFSAPPYTVLRANTQYFVQVAYSGSWNSSVQLRRLGSTAENADRASGWSINNFILTRDHGTNLPWISKGIGRQRSQDGAMKTRVNGTAGAPSGLSAQSVSGKPGYLHMSWTPAPDAAWQPIATDYEARYRKTRTTTWATWSFRDYGTPGFTGPARSRAAPQGGEDAPIIYFPEANTQYDVEVRATNPYGESGWSNRVTARTAQATTANDDGTVDTSGGTPTIALTLGGTQQRSARYASGSGTEALVFAYTLSESDGTHPAMGVAPESLALNGGSIASEATGVDADLSHDGTIIMGTRDAGRGVRGVPERTGPTASFSDLPATHDGATAVKVKLTFSEEPERG